MPKLPFLFVPLLVGVVALVPASPALAASPSAPLRAVAYADLDLSSTAGRARLERRIGAAVRSVCGTAFPVDLRGVAEVRACRAETLASVGADRRVGSVIVSQPGLGTQ